MSDSPWTQGDIETVAQSDTAALRAEFDVCGACDYGVAVGCSCSSREPRAVISELCDEVDRLREVLDRVGARADEWEADADAHEDTHRVESRTMLSAARELRSLLNGSER